MSKIKSKEQIEEDKTIYSKEKSGLFRPLFCTTYGIRTRDSSVKGRRLNPLTNAAFPVWDCKDTHAFFTSKFYGNIFFTNESSH